MSQGHSQAQRSARRRVVLAFGVAAPVLLLAAGWLVASSRERDSRLEARLASLTRTLDAGRDAVAADLEALRRREDERPFYLYNYYYSPPEVLSISDPIAISPLAAPSEDPRVLGHFQIDPDGTVRMPSAPQPRDAQSPRQERVLAAARSEALSDLRELVAPRGALIATVQREALPELGASAESDSGAAATQLTVTLNQIDNVLATEIQAAQAGDSEAFGRVVRRGRAAPITTRRSVGIDAIERRDEEQARTPRVRARPAPAPAPAPTTAPPLEHDAPVVPREVEVDYTPMSWRSAADALAMARIVSHEGAAVVQGVAFDPAALRASIATRLSEADPEGLVEVRSDDTGCLDARTHASFPPDTVLCVAPSAIAATRAALDRELVVESLALLVLLLFVTLALVATHRAAQREEALARQRSEFVSAVSHELRTPLTTLRMHAEMLAEGLVPSEREERVYRELANETARLSRLVENVLEVSRLEAGKRPLERARVDLRARVRALAEQHAPLAQARGGAIEAPAVGPAITVELDPDALERVVVNLVDNALKYGAPGGSAELFVDEEGDFAVLSVCDRGEGIPASEAERVFERFVRVAREADAHQPGTGLGLALVRELARAHGGDAEVRARVGGGAEVRVKFPKP